MPTVEEDLKHFAILKSRTSKRTRWIVPAIVLCVASLCLLFSPGKSLKSDEQIPTENADSSIDDLSAPSSFAFGRSGKVIAFGFSTFDEQKGVELRIVNSSKEKEPVRIGFSESFKMVNETIVSPDERLVAGLAQAFDGSGEWFVFDRQTKQISKQFPRVQEYALGFTFSDDSTLLAYWAAGNAKAGIHVRRISDGKRVGQFDLTEAKQFVSHLALSSRHNALAFVPMDPESMEAKDLVFWDWKQNQVRRVPSKLKYPVSQLAFSPNGEFLVTGGGPEYRGRKPIGPSEIVVWNLEGKRIAELQGVHGQVQSLCFSADGSRLAASGYDTWNPMKIVTWQTKDWKQDKSLTSKATSAVLDLHFRDNNTLRSASRDGMMREWDLRDSSLVSESRFFKLKQ